MISIRKNNDRGNSKTSWLNSYHTFSFADYYDPQFMGFGNLRVINEDTVQPGYGFGRHPHNNMEIISYVVEGSLEHHDSMGTGSIIKPGEIQIMSAGTGVEHSEFNHSKTDLLHFLQIWIIPQQRDLSPSYQQKNIKKTTNQFILIASQDGQDETVIIHQKISLYVAYFTKGHLHNYLLKPDHKGWVQLIKGKVDLNGKQLSAGDGSAITGENKLDFHCRDNAELLMFDLT